MFPNYVTELVARERYNDLLREAERQRLIRIALGEQARRPRQQIGYIVGGLLALVLAVALRAAIY